MDFSPTAVVDALPCGVAGSDCRPRTAETANRKPRPVRACSPRCVAALPADLSRSADDALIAQAIALLEGRMRRNPVALSSPREVEQFLTLRFAGLEHEVFACLWLDAANRLIAAEELFRGTLTQTSVYPREIVKQGLRYNAAAVVLAHNHPSGNPTPSNADRMLTSALKTALALVDVQVLDHIVVAGTQTTSFASHGLL